LCARRKLVCVALTCVLPSALMGQDSAAAVLRSNGGVMLNGNAAPVSSALFKDDNIQTQPAATAKIDATGSTVDVQPETFLQFEGDELALQHGTLQLITSRGMKVRVGCLRVVPINMDWTQYDVTDVDGKVTVVAHKNDVKIESRGARLPKNRPGGRSEDIVHAGERATRSDSCGADIPSQAPASGGVLNSPKVIWAAVGVITVGVTCWILCENEPISPSGLEPPKK